MASSTGACSVSTRANFVGLTRPYFSYSSEFISPWIELSSSRTRARPFQHPSATRSIPHQIGRSNHEPKPQCPIDPIVVIISKSILSNWNSSHHIPLFVTTRSFEDGFRPCGRPSNTSQSTLNAVFVHRYSNSKVTLVPHQTALDFITE